MRRMLTTCTTIDEAEKAVQTPYDEKFFADKNAGDSIKLLRQNLATP